MGLSFISSSFNQTSSFYIESGGLSSSLQSGSYIIVTSRTLGSLGADFTTDTISFTIDSSSAGGSDDITVLSMSGSGDAPLIGIGTATPLANLDIRSITSSDPANITLRTNEDGVIQVGEETGRIIFAIESSSYLGTDFISSGSTAAIFSRVKEAGASGAYGSLIFEVNDNDERTKPFEILELGYGVGGFVSGQAGARVSGSLEVSSEFPTFNVKNPVNGNSILYLGPTVTDILSYIGGGSAIDRGNFFLYNDGDVKIRLNTTADSFINDGNNLGIGTENPESKLHVIGDIKATGDIIAQRYIVSSSVSHITSSFSSGSTVFGDTLDDTHQFTGSLNITGSITATEYIGLPSGLVSGSSQITIGSTTGTITSAKISDVDAFSQSGTYASLRAQGTTKGDVGLGNVENTALSTYTGNGGALDNQYITNGAGYTTNTGTVDTSGTPVDNDFAKFTDANTIEGRSYSEVKTDLSLNNVENTALSTYTGNGGALDNQYITNGAGYTTNTGTVTSVGGTGTVSGLSLSGTVTTSGNLTLGGTISISSTNITDVDAFSQTGTYASLRAQGTTAGDVGLGNVTNESKATMFTSPTFTGTVAIPGFADVSASLAAAVAGGDNLGNHTATTTLNLDGNNITNVDTITSVTNGDITIDPGGSGGLLLKSTAIGIQHSGFGAGSLSFYELGNAQYTQLQGQTVASNIIVNLPTSAGTLALTSDVPTNNNELTNGAGYTTNTGTVTEVTVGTGLDVSSGTTTPNISLDLTEITVGTGLDTTATGISLDLTEVGFGAGASDRLITNDGDGTVTAEANLTFDGSTLNVDGKIDVDDSTTSGAIVDISNNTTSIMGADHYSLKVAGGQAIGTPGGQTKGYGGYFTAGDTNGTNPDTIALYAQGHEDGAPNSYAAIFSGSAGGVVGINTMEPTVELEVDGDGKFSGTLEIGGISDVSASIAAAGGGGGSDNLGDHTATQDLDLNSNSIKGITHITASGNISASGIIVPQFETKVHTFFTSDSNGDLIPMGGTLSESTTPQYYLSYLSPYGGQLIRAYVMTTSSSTGDFTLSLRRYTNFSTFTTIATATGTINSSYTPTLATFSAHTFSAGDWLALHFDPTGTPSGVNVTSLWRMDSI